MQLPAIEVKQSYGSSELIILMDKSQEKRQEECSINWDEALHLYESVVEGEDTTLRIQATVKLAKISKFAPENILARAVGILVKLLQDQSIDSSLPIQEAAVCCLKCIACEGEGRLAVLIGQSGVVPILLRSLLHSDGSLQKALLKCLRNIVTFGAPNRTIIASNGGTEIILSMLDSCTDVSKLLCLEILSALALVREVRRLLCRSGNVRFLVESARYGSMISRTRAAQAIGLLGLVNRARRTLVDLGAIPVLMSLLQNGDTVAKLVAGNALGVISSHVDYIRPLAQAGGIPLVADLLEGPEPTGKEIAEDVFCILAVLEDNAVIIVENLVRILRVNNEEEAKAAAADILWDLSSYDHIQPIISSSGAIPVLVELLTDESYDVRDKVSATIAQLSHNERDRVAIADCGAIPLLMNMLQDESEEAKDNAAEILVNLSKDHRLGDRISFVVQNPLFQRMQHRLMVIQASHEHLARSLRSTIIERLASDPRLA